MKKLLALAMILCVFCLSFAHAETAESSLLELDDFSLALDAGMMYSAADKAPQVIMLKVFPFAASGDNSTNIGFVWAGAPFDASPETMDETREETKQGMIQGIEAAGYSADSVEIGDSYESTIGGEPCVACEMTTVMSFASLSAVIMQRQFTVGTKGYVITISAGDAEALDRATELLDSILSWK